MTARGPGHGAQEGCVEAAVWLRSPWGVRLPLGPDTLALCVCNPLHNMCVVFVNIHSHTLIVTALVPFEHRYPSWHLCSGTILGGWCLNSESPHVVQRHSIYQKFDHWVIILFMIISR